MAHSLEARLQVELEECNQLGLMADWVGDWDIHVEFDFGDARYLLRVSIPAHYPQSHPQIVLTHPFVYYTPTLYARLSWNEHTTLFGWISLYIDTTFRAMVEMRATMALPRITDPAYLVLGGSPSEDPRGRSHYDHPHVFFLDRSGDVGLPRFFHIDFANPAELGVLASLLPGAFDEICFDWSTLKFFNSDGGEEDALDNAALIRRVNPTGWQKMVEQGYTMMLHERLVYLRIMLKEGGRIFFENFDSPPNGSQLWVRSTTDYRTWFLSYCIRAGFSCRATTTDEIGNTSILTPLLFHETPVPILIARKIRTPGRFWR